MSDRLLSEIKAALKKHNLHYKILDYKFEDNLHFLDTERGIHTSGKIVETFTEGEVYHWPLLSHENLAPLIDGIFIRDKLSVLITIDKRITLKNIIHEEDFFYDPRCFERKKSYARGIFSGLNYLHEKSLCLMNLSDTNVVICKLNDQAIISDFSSLICSRRTIKSKLAVKEQCRAPETHQKNDFDPIAAEIWTAGVLMLDLFLAHLTPWAVIDHKPNLIMRIVEKLSFELLQTANIGSVITTFDLIKFQAFLKCFFREIPLSRISARNAIIASFLKPKLHDRTLKVVPMKMPSKDTIKTDKKVIDIPLSRKDSNFNVTVPNETHFEKLRTNSDKHQNVNNPNRLQGDKQNEKNTSSNSQLSVFKGSTPEFALHTKAQEENPVLDTDASCQHTKSLSMLQAQLSENSDFPNMYCSCPNMKATLVPEKKKIEMKNRDSFLSIPLSRTESVDGKSCSNNKKESPVHLKISKDDLQDKKTFQNAQSKVNSTPFSTIGEIRKSLTNLQKRCGGAEQMSIYDTIQKLNFIMYYLKSLRNHKEHHISDEFEEKLIEILDQYEHLLIQERIRLSKILVEEYNVSSKTVHNRCSPKPCPIKPVRKTTYAKCLSNNRISRFEDNHLIVKHGKPSTEIMMENNTQLHETKQKLEPAISTENIHRKIDLPKSKNHNERGSHTSQNSRVHRRYSYRQATANPYYQKNPNSKLLRTADSQGVSSAFLPNVHSRNKFPKSQSKKCITVVEKGGKSSPNFELKKEINRENSPEIKEKSKSLLKRMSRKDKAGKAKKRDESGKTKKRDESGKTKKRDESEKTNKRVKSGKNNRETIPNKPCNLSTDEPVANIPNRCSKEKKPRRPFFFALCPRGTIEESTPALSQNDICQACKFKHD